MASLVEVLQLIILDSGLIHLRFEIVAPVDGLLATDTEEDLERVWTRDDGLG